MQEKSDQEKEKSRFKLAQSNRTHYSNGNQIKDSRRNIKRKRKGITFPPVFGTNNIILQKSNIQVKSLIGSGVFEYGTVDEIIRDIYPVIKDDISIFLHTRAFNELTKPFEFLEWMIKSFNDVTDSKECSLDYSLENKKFILKEIIEVEKLKCRGYSPELNFLVELMKTNRNLYSLFIGLFGLFKSELQAVFYFDNDEIDNIFETLEEELKWSDEEDFQKNKDILEDYKSGNPKIVETEIKSSKMTVDELYVSLIKFSAKTVDELKCVEFIKESLILFDYKESFFDYVHFVGNELELGQPVSPMDYMSFGWSYDNENWVDSYLMEENNQNYHEYGIVPARREIINGNHNDETQFIHKFGEMLDNLCVISELIKNSESS